MKIGKLLKIYLDINEISYREFANEINMSHSTVSRVIEGKQIDTENTIKLINWLLQKEKE